MTPADGLFIAAMAVLLAAALFDCVRMEIPDSLSILLLLLAAAHALVADAPSPAMRMAALGLMLALGLLLSSRGWMGGGDIKLLVATAPLLGLAALAPWLMFVALAGGVLALVMLPLRRLAGAVAAAGSQPPLVLRRSSPLPYAVAILAGTLAWAWRAGLLPV